MAATDSPDNMVAVAEFIMAQLRLGTEEEEIQKALIARGISGDLVGQIKKIFDFVLPQIDTKMDGMQHKNICTYLTSLNLDAALVGAIMDKACAYRLQEMNTNALKYDVFAKSQVASNMNAALQEMLDRTGRGAPDPLPPPTEGRRQGIFKKIWHWLVQK